MAKRKSSRKTKAKTPEILPPESHAKNNAKGRNLHHPTSPPSSEEEDVPWSDDPSDTSSEFLPAPKTSETDLPDTAALSPTDPLRRYMQEVGRYPLLTPEEELELVRRMREEGDVNAARRLVTANLRLVVKIAFEYRTIYSNLLDLIQEGNVGLMKAVSKFDPSKGARIGYYASWWIRSYILKYLIDNFRLVRVGTTQAQKKLFYHLMREKQRIEAQGLLAGPKLLADRLNVREQDVIEMEQRLSSSGAEMSLDTPIGGDSEGGGRNRTLIETLEDDYEMPETALERAELLRILEDRLPDFMDHLNEKELRILEERILAEEPKTLQEVADHYGLTRERARQIEAKVIDKLRKFLGPEIGLEDESKKKKER